MENKTEILAPAGAREQLEAAVHAGCDAVYLGYGSFNARRNAANFTYEQLKDAVKYCHERGVSVHATLNTLIQENELELAFKDAVDIRNAGCDAVIVQDLGLARLIHEHLPELSMHASTQLTVHNVSGVKMLKALGFSRAVLSRELSLEEIKEICASTDIEIEVFIHGALCMCISGGCYLSSMLGQRSGNRGLCAQPCRLNFTVNKREYALSLKDMSHLSYIGELQKIGVKAFKIEGRMKRPEYVAAAVSCAKGALKGDAYNIDELRSVFSRSGFTDGYMINKRNLSMFGYRKKEDVVAAEGVLCDIRNRFRNELQSVWLKAAFCARLGEGYTLTLSDGSNTVTKKGVVPEKAINRSTTEQDVKKQLSKTGGTPFYIKELDISLDDGLMLPLSNINAVRREALDALLSLRGASVAPTNASYSHTVTKRTERKGKNIIRLLKKEQLFETDGIVILPIDEIDESFFGENTGVEIPSLVFPTDEKRTIERLRHIRELGVSYALCENIGAIYLARQLGFKLIAGYGMNILNSLTQKTLEEAGVEIAVASFESNIKNYEALSGGIPCGIITYGYLPLMRMRACPAQNKGGCIGCSGINTMTDRKNISFTLLCNNRKFTTLLNSVPLYVSDKGYRTDFQMMYFNLEAPIRVREIYSLCVTHKAPDFERTVGLYNKTLL